MPNRTIYIRNEDLPLWDKCSNKAELMSLALRGQVTMPTNASVIIDRSKLGVQPAPPKERGVDAIGTITGNPGKSPEMTIPGKAVVQPKVAKTVADVKKAVVKDNFCEHGFAPGFCKHAKCKNASRR